MNRYISCSKKCQVCGDQASGFNYEGLSCESCKVFFCRNSNKIEILRCDFARDCNITIGTRKKCPKCRLIKCLSIGMKRRGFTKCKDNIPIEDGETQKGVEPILEISILKFLSDFDKENVTKYVSNHFDSQRKRLPLEMSQFELEQITEAQNAVGFVFREERHVPIVKYLYSYDEELIDSTIHYITKGINFCQHFAAFNSLNNEDQLVLLKPFILDMLGLWFTFQYDAKNQGCLIFTDESQTGTYFVSNEVGLKYYKNKRVLMHAMMQCGYELQDAMENDSVIRDLLCAITLFKNKENLTCSENVRYHHHLYMMLLLRYLQQKRQSKLEGNRKYLHLMRLIGQMTDFSKYRKEFARDFGVERLPPIILELYDMA